MIIYRPFLNTDPPLLVEVWRNQKRFPNLASTVTVAMLEDTLFAKPYFQAAGLILAIEDGKALGFVHAGFAATPDEMDLDQKSGVISQLRVVPGDKAEEVTDGLMNAALDFLRNNGAENAYFGSRFPSAPFYMGLYGGSRIPGIVEGDDVAELATKKFGFEQISEISIFRRSLVGFRTIVDRRQMKVRRAYQILADADPGLSSWNEACTLGRNMRMRFKLIDRKDNSTRGAVSFWDMEPIANSWGVVAMGMYNLNVDDEARREGLATFLVGEALRHLASQSIGVVEAQTNSENTATCGLLEKLGFEKAGVGRQVLLEL